MAAAASAGDDAIALEAVSRVYGEGPAQVRAVDGVSLRIRRNEFFTLLGPSGCGKTTLLRMIAGFEPADRRPDPARRPRCRRAAAVQAAGEHGVPGLRAVPAYDRGARTSAFGLEMLRQPQARRSSARVAEMLRLVRMDRLANRAHQPDLRRPAAARGAGPRAGPAPEVLLLDEPLSALDLKLRKAMQIELKRLQRDTGITFVFVTHDQEEALAMSDRIAVMSQGKVRQVGSPREIYDHPAERFVADFIGEANMLAGELVRTEGGDRLGAPGARNSRCVARVPPGAPTAGPVTVVVRPEHATLTKDGAGHGLPATLDNAVFVGSDTQYHLRLGSGTPFVVRSQNSSADAAIHRPGDRLCVLLGDHSVQVLRD